MTRRTVDADEHLSSRPPASVGNAEHASAEDSGGHPCSDQEALAAAPAPRALLRPAGVLAGIVAIAGVSLVRRRRPRTLTRGICDPMWPLANVTHVSP